MPEQHSHVVGGSTAKRVLNCLGSRREIAKAPSGGSSSFADEGTMLHEAIALILDYQVDAPRDVIGTKYKGHELTEDLYEVKIQRALEVFDGLDDIEYEVEAMCELKSIPGAFGTTDIIARAKDRTIVLDWKFGDGVPVSAKNSEQGMFYAGAAMETPALQDMFDLNNFKWPVEIIMVQPKTGEDDIVSRWTTSVGHIRKFVKSLAIAVRAGDKPDAPLTRGDWCRFCPAKVQCPEYNQIIDQALNQSVKDIKPEEIAKWLDMADDLASWVKDVKNLGHRLLEQGHKIPDWKLVPKRATRKWVDEDVAQRELIKVISDASRILKTALVSPAQAEQVLKAEKIDVSVLQDLVKSASSGTTLARSKDPRQEVAVPAAAIRGLAKKLKR